MRSCAKTDVGRRRTMNQDSVFRTDQQIGGLSNLYIVADGMGGHNAGDFASRDCVEVLSESVRLSTVGTPPIEILKGAIAKANADVYRRAQQSEEMQGMGTTLVAATIQEGNICVANIGDSRLYILDSEQIRQVTVDHSLVETMVQSGQITREQARIHENKNIITRALGTSRRVMPDFFQVRLQKGNIVLMCTDGLSNMLEDEEILYIVNSQPDIDKALQRLIDEANEQGGRDNIGIVLIQP